MARKSGSRRTPTVADHDASGRPTVKVDGAPSLAELWAKAPRGPFATVERALATQGYVADEELAQALRANPGAPLPPPVLDYLCRRLEGNAGPPRGRRRRREMTRLRDALIGVLYGTYLRRLQVRARRSGLPERPGVDWWRGPPHERAARMTAERLRRLGFPALDWRHVLNLVSSG